MSVRSISSIGFLLRASAAPLAHRPRPSTPATTRWSWRPCPADRAIPLPRSCASCAPRSPRRRRMPEPRRASRAATSTWQWQKAIPRYVGYAEAALRPWPETAAAPAEILVCTACCASTATISRGDGGFRPRAERDPANSEARSWRAAILMVQADYAGARRECEWLAPTRDRAACDGLHRLRRGDDRQRARRVRAAFRGAGAPARRRPGIRTLDPDAARGNGLAHGRPCRRGTAFPPGPGARRRRQFPARGVCRLSARARPRTEVVPLLQGLGALRHAAAASRPRRPRAQARRRPKQYARTLGDRFADAALRGERLHLQEEARFLLDLKGDARAALAAAAKTTGRSASRATRWWCSRRRSRRATRSGRAGAAMARIERLRERAHRGTPRRS